MGEAGDRPSTHVTFNYVVLMALAGAIAAAGLLMHGVVQGITIVGASIIAAGFEPIAKVVVGFTLRDMAVAKDAMISRLQGTRYSR